MFLSCGYSCELLVQQTAKEQRNQTLVFMLDRIKGIANVQCAFFPPQLLKAGDTIIYGKQCVGTLKAA